MVTYYNEKKLGVIGCDRVRDGDTSLIWFYQYTKSTLSSRKLS